MSVRESTASALACCRLQCVAHRVPRSAPRLGEGSQTAVPALRTSLLRRLIAGELPDDLVQGVRVRVRRLLLGREAPPGVRRPAGGRGRRPAPCASSTRLCEASPAGEADAQRSPMTAIERGMPGAAGGSDGAVLVPVQLSVLKDGKLYLPPGAFTYLEAAMLIGRWQADGSLEWELGARLTLPPEISLRGAFEPTVAEFPDGRLLAAGCRHHHRIWHRRGWVMRATDAGWFWWQTPAGRTVECLEMSDTM